MRILAHVMSLGVLKISVKVVRHTKRDSFCGELWKSLVATQNDWDVRFPRSPPFAKSREGWATHCVNSPRETAKA